MRMRVLFAAGALAIVPALAGAQEPPATAAAHREGGIELTVGAGLFTVDQTLNTFLSQSTVRIANPDPNWFMFGAEVRAAYNFSRHLGLSLGTGIGNGSGTLLIAPFGALTYTFDLNRKFSPFIEVGGGVTRFSAYAFALAGAPDHRVTSKYNAFGGLGVRSMLGEHLALRVAGRMGYEKFEENGGMNVLNGTAVVGLSLFLGGGPPRDTDADGVPDKRDRCASTPRGATVDLPGCPSDTDRDGVLNGLDRCPDTPANTPVDADGCTRDTDTDGVADNLDRCANTPANARPVDANGCPVDTDRDGVADYLDRCANTAAGTQVGASGCPVRRDTDGDGVLDSSDRCPNTPAGSRVDANGCPPAEPTGLPALPDVGQSLVLSAVQFSAAGSRLTGASQTVLDGIAAAIVATPNSRWEVAGHTSSTGTRAGNLQLSQARARAVARYLISRGVGTGVLTAVGYGSANPVALNTTAVGRAQNRRVEIKRLQ